MVGEDGLRADGDIVVGRGCDVGGCGGWASCGGGRFPGAARLRSRGVTMLSSV
jgi:hypothetical protein